MCSSENSGLTELGRSTGAGDGQSKRYATIDHMHENYYCSQHNKDPSLPRPPKEGKLT